MKILVVGSTGFIGKPLVNEINYRIKNVKVYELSRHGKIKCDVRNISCLKRLKEKKFDIAIFLTAKIWYTWLPSIYPYSLFLSLNTKTVKNVIRSLKVNRFIYVSSLAVLDKSLTKIRPRGYYGITKYFGEKVCMKLLKKRCLIIRLPMVYDPFELKKETRLFYSLRYLLKLVKPLSRKIFFRVISRKEAVDAIIKSITKKYSGIITIDGRKISLYDFILKIEKERKAIPYT